MSLNIKNERVHALAKRASALTGLTQTSAIERALEQFIANQAQHQTAESRRSAADRIVSDFEAALSDTDRRRLVSDDLYDDAGLPS